MAVLALLFAAPAGAVPSFARRYGTSCQTCHVAYPKLTPFGEAFRRLAYRFPEGQDEDYRRQEPQKLGADAYKDVFPDAVWPGEIPSEIPLSLILASNVVGTREGDREVRFDGVGGSVTLNAATPLGESLSTWIGVGVSGSQEEEATVELERAFVVLTPFERPFAALRVGRIEPQVLGFSSHRMLGLAPWILTTAVGDNEWSLEPAQLGFEATGILRGRFTYAVGVVEGAGNNVNAPKDVYVRLAYKLGGMRLDGVSGGGELNLADPAPWREWSVTAGSFGYVGFAEIGDPAVASQRDRFFLSGGDVTAQLRDVSITGAFALGRNERPLLAEPNDEVRSRHFFAQVEWVQWPWLVPLVRYERREVGEVSEDRIAPIVYVLIRANVRATVLGTVARSEGGTFALDRIQGGLSVAF